jgi:hypothetical protein
LSEWPSGRWILPTVDGKVFRNAYREGWQRWSKWREIKEPVWFSGDLLTVVVATTPGIV